MSKRLVLWLAACVGVVAAFIVYSGFDDKPHRVNVGGTQCIMYKSAITCDWNTP